MNVLIICRDFFLAQYEKHHPEGPFGFLLCHFMTSLENLNFNVMITMSETFRLYIIAPRWAGDRSRVYPPLGPRTLGQAPADRCHPKLDLMLIVLHTFLLEQHTLFQF